jgi:hypothetical protein
VKNIVGWTDAQLMEPRSIAGYAGNQYRIPGTVRFVWPVGRVSAQYLHLGRTHPLPAVGYSEKTNATILLSIIAFAKIGLGRNRFHFRPARWQK